MFFRAALRRVEIVITRPSGGHTEVIGNFLNMDSRCIWLLVVLVVLVALSGFFSAMETAYTSFSAVRMRRMARTKRSARLAFALSADYNRVLSTLLIADNIVNIASASIGTLIFTSVMDAELGATVSTIVLTVVVLIFGEITPKVLARRLPESFACASAYPLRVLVSLFLPLSFLFGLWKKFIFWLFRLGRKHPKFTEEEFGMLVTDVKEDGVLNETEHDLIQRTLRYDDLLVKDCMVPLARMVTVESRASDRLVFHIFRETNFSRLPVYKGTKGNVIGVLYRADFYENMLSGRRDFENLIRPVAYTEADEKVSRLMKRMQAGREHIVIVGAEGNALGMITREDIIEELLGDVDDKYDLTPVTAPPAAPVPQGGAL